LRAEVLHASTLAWALGRPAAREEVVAAELDICRAADWKLLPHALDGMARAGELPRVQSQVQM
jgi:hypothetical protein